MAPTFIDPGSLYVWVHTWWGRDGVRDATLRSLDASDAKGRYHVHRQGKDVEKVDFFIDTMKAICARPEVKWILRLEDDTLVNRHLIHNTCSWPAPHKEPSFGMGFLSVPTPVLEDKAHVGLGEILGTPWRTYEGGMHFGGGILWKADTISALLTEVETCMRRHLPHLACAVCPSSVMLKHGLRSYFHTPSIVKIDLTLPRHLDGKAMGDAYYGKQPFEVGFRRKNGHLPECFEKRIPWFTWSAIDRARDISRNFGITSVLEWGAGGSTLFWLDAGLEVVTVEHDEKWLQVVRQNVRATDLPRWRPLLIPPTSKGQVTSRRAGGLFDTYVAAPNSMQFDLVCIDGRARNACAAVAVQVATKFVILDNSDRQDYAEAKTVLGAWGAAEEHAGSGPQSGGIEWKTTLYTRK